MSRRWKAPWPGRPRYRSPSMTSGPRRRTLSTEPGIACPRRPSSRRSCDGWRRRWSCGRFGIEDDEVGVRAGRDRALARVEPEHLRRRRRADLDPPVQRVRPWRQRRRRSAPCGARRRARRWGSCGSHPGRAPSGTSRTGSGRWRRPAGRWCAARATGRLWCSLARSGGEHTYLAPSKSGRCEVVEVEEEVLRARLGEHVPALVAGRRHLVEGLGRRQVHDVEGHAGDVGEHGGTLHRLGLEHRRAGQTSGTRGRWAPVDRLLAQHVDGDAVLGVHHDQPAVDRRTAASSLRIWPSAEYSRSRVGHEHLEAGDAVVDEEVHLLR